MEKHKINGLQVLRGIAACAFVLLCAYSRGHRIWPAAHSLFDNVNGMDAFGNPGVDFFLVLSGFLMTYLYAPRMGIPDASAEFVMRRVIRIVPVYWLLSLLGLVLLVTVPHLFNHQKGYEWSWVFGCFAFIPWPQSNGSIAPIISTALPLSYAMYFYLLFALALTMRRGLLYLIGFLIICVAIGEFAKPAQWWLDIPTCYMLMDFLWGIFIALIVADRPVSRSYAIAYICLGVVALAYTSFHYQLEERAFLWGLPCALIVLGTIWASFKCESRTARLLMLMGNASYSLFLTPAFVLPVIGMVMHLFHHIVQLDPLVVVMWIFTCASGVIFWRLIERPVNSFLLAHARSFHQAFHKP